MTQTRKGGVRPWFIHYIGGGVLVALIPFLDAVIGYDIARQIDASRFAATTGTITHSEVFWYRDNDGDTFTGADIRYSYAVGGRAFEGNTLRYSTAHFNTSQSGWAERAVRNHPLGASAKVYYDPRDPAQSLLQPGFSGTELYLAMFMTLFNAWMLATWFVGGPTLLRRLRGKPPKLPPLLHDRSATRMRFAQNAGALGALAGVGVASAIGVFTQPLDASLAAMQVAWVLVLTVGAVLGLWFWLERRSGAFDLIIRETNVTLPERLGRWRRPRLERATITGVTVKPGWRGIFANQVRIECANGRSEKLAAWYDENAANALASHAGEALGLSPTGA